MAKTEPSLVVCDAGPLIHLDQLACLDLLQGWGRVLVPSEVWTEATYHRPSLTISNLANVQVRQAATVPPSPRLIVVSDSFDLDAGERAALALIESTTAHMFFCDDAAARLAAESLGIAVHGTIGILVRSIRVGSRTRQEIIDVLRELPHKSSLHISRRLLETVLVEVEKD
jgi:predicted nucleic acid-binding protein